MGKMNTRRQPERKQLTFVPEYHEGAHGEPFYALPAHQGGVSTRTYPGLHRRCWAVYRAGLACNALGVYDTYEEANDVAASQAMEEFVKGHEIHMRVAGLVRGWLFEGEEWQ